jgi:hypothetical protein
MRTLTLNLMILTATITAAPALASPRDVVPLTPAQFADISGRISAALRSFNGRAPGEANYGACKQSGLAAVRCVFKFDPGANYAYYNTVTIEASYPEGAVAEELSNLQIGVEAK